MDLNELRGWAAFMDRAVIASLVATVLSVSALGVTTWLSFRFGGEVRAQEQAAFLIDERGLTQAAETQSREIIATAHSDADEIRRGADEYAVGVLVGLEGDVVKTLQSIKKGIALLDERRSSLSSEETDDGDDGGAGERWEDEAAEPSNSTR